MKVTVLTGGSTGEREVSLASGMEVARALREAGHEVAVVDTARGGLGPAEEEEILETGVRSDPPELAALDALAGGSVAGLVGMPEIAGADIVFIALHGGAGEDGRVQAVLELEGIAYVGSGPLACGMAMDKDISKRLFRAAGVPTPDWRMWPATEVEAAELGYPLVVKPNAEGSTLGLTVVREPDHLEAAVETARRYDPRVMLEEMVTGRELTVPVVGDDVYPVGEIIPQHEIFDYECKYQPGMAEEIFPADLPVEVTRYVQELTLRAHRSLRMVELSRIDFIIDDEGVAWCLEANALPGMTSNSLVPKSGVAAGTSFPELCSRLCELAARRWEQAR